MTLSKCDCTQKGIFWVYFEFYALLFGFVSDFALRTSKFVFFISCLWRNS